MAIIYEIRNTATQEVYIGRTNALTRRWHDHRRELRRGVHTSKALQAAWKAYGPDNFQLSVLEEISDLELCQLREKTLIAELQPAYNTEYTNRVGARHRGRRARYRDVAMAAIEAALDAQEAARQRGEILCECGRLHVFEIANGEVRVWHR